MEKKEVVFVVVIIVLLAAVLLVSGAFYFSVVFGESGLTGNVVVGSENFGRGSFDGGEAGLKNEEMSDSNDLNG